MTEQSSTPVRVKRNQKGHHLSPTRAAHRRTASARERGVPGKISKRTPGLPIEPDDEWRERVSALQIYSTTRILTGIVLCPPSAVE